MPVDKAKEFFEGFKQAEGAKKWVYLVMFVLAIVLATFDPTWSVYILITLTGLEGVVAAWQEHLAKKEVEDPEVE